MSKFDNKPKIINESRDNFVNMKIHLEKINQSVTQIVIAIAT